MVKTKNIWVLLSDLKHSFKTNFDKGKCTNQDALTMILHAHGGTMKVKDIRNAMMTWRFGTPKYDEQTRYDWYTKKNVKRHVPKMGFSYLFNTSHSGGYGFTGNRAMSRGQHMNTYGTVGLNCVDENVWFRRHTWYRSGKGIYSLTVEGFKRLTELGIVSFFD